MAFTKEQLATRLQKAKDRFAKDSSDKKATLAQQRETKKRMKRAARKYRSSVDFIDRREKRRAKDGE